MLTRVGVPVQSEVVPIGPDAEPATLLCFSHLRWNFVFQRPQHLMMRFGREMDVIFWEEPVEIGPKETAYLQVREAEGVAERSCRRSPPPRGHERGSARSYARTAARRSYRIDPRAAHRLVLYADDAALLAAHHADLTVYDAMDELSKFKFAPEHLLSFEQELIDRADILFTGGSSLYEAKKDRHDNVHCFPSSVDRCHFAKARVRQFEPADQEDLPKPRLGFYGVIDERFDTELLAKAAEMRPDWSFVMLGPVVKIADEDLPRRHNIHYLGSKTYEQLPSYLSGWDVALMPFAMNESTAVHLADQDSRISRGRQARRIDADQGRRASLRAFGRRADRIDGRTVRRWLREGARAFTQAGKRLARGGGPPPFRDELGHHPGSHGRLGPRFAWNARRRVLTGPDGSRGMSALIGGDAHSTGRRYDYLIVGAGFAGSVLAERLASQHGARVLLIDRRDACRRQRL